MVLNYEQLHKQEDSCLVGHLESIVYIVSADTTASSYLKAS